MKRLGIVGGIGPESTIVYYRTILRLHREARPTAADPELLIAHFDVRRLLGRVAANELDELAGELAQVVERLAGAGADFALLAANTPHLVFDQVQSRAPLPLLNLIDCVGAAAAERGFSRLGILGTRFTMEGGFYAERLAGAGLSIAAPEPADRELVHRIYVDELIAGTVREASRAELLEVVSRLRRRQGVEAVVLAGTELSLILGDDVAADVPLLDSTRLHADEAVRWLLKDGRPG